MVVVNNRIFLTLSGLLLCGTASHLSAQAPDTATCIASPRPQITGLPDFMNDDGFDLATEVTATGTRVRVTGDKVVIDADRLTSILASPSSPKTGITSLVFDAREVIVRGSIALEGGDVSIYADSLVFEKGGQITLVPLSGKPQRSLTVVTNSLVFKGARRRPFDLGLDASDAVNVGIAAVTITDTQGGNLWSRFVDSVDSDTPPKQVQIVVGAKAGALWDQSFARDMEWPLYFAAKVRRHFNRDPFNPGIGTNLSAIIGRYDAVMPSWRDARPLSVLSSVKAAIRNATDIDGRAFSFTPKENLQSQRAAIERRLSSGIFEDLVEILAATDVPKANVADLLKSARAELDLVNQHHAELTMSIDADNITLQNLNQAAAGIDVRLSQRTQYLATLQAQEFASLKKAQAVRQWTTVAASAVVIAASMGAATPAVAAGVATGVSLIGETAAQRNSSAPVKIETLISQGAQTYAAALKFRDAWNAVRADQGALSDLYAGKEIKDGPPPDAGKLDDRKPLTKTAATKRLASSLGEAVKAIQGISGDQMAWPTPLSLSDRQNEDEDFKAILVERAGNRESFSLKTAEVHAHAVALEALLNRRAELQSVEFALREAAPTNDQETARWKANATLLWGMNIQQLSTMLNTYRKSLYFETGLIPTGPANVLDYPNELDSKVTLGVFNPNGGIEQSKVMAERRDRLKGESAKFAAAMKTAAQSVERSYVQYLNTRSDADVYRKAIRFSANSPDQAVRAFIQSINGQIAQQIAGGSNSTELFPIFLPYTFSKSVNKYPERLLHATVTSVTFDVTTSKIGSNALSFNIIHPQYGVMRRPGDCFAADLRDSPTDWRNFNVPFEGIQKDWLKLQPKHVVISRQDPNRFYTYLPARAPYHVVVNVISQKWFSIPRITSIEFGFEVMQ